MSKKEIAEKKASVKARKENVKDKSNRKNVTEK